MTRMIDLADFQQGAFVETGTGQGYRVIDAMRHGFPVIYSVELSEEVFASTYATIQQAVPTIPTISHVTLLQGDTIATLPGLCDLVKARQIYALSSIVTFWLDARPLHHPDGRVTAGSPPYPLLDELAILRKAFRGELWVPIILVNGISECLHGIQVGGAPITLAKVEAAIRAIDPDYTFEIGRVRSASPELVAGAEDVLAAYPAWFIEACRPA